MADPPPPSPSLLPVMLGSALSGALARLALHPLDTLKSRLQAAPGGARGAGLAATARAALAAEGARGLYRGLTVATLCSAPASCAYFTAYTAAKAALEPAAAAAGGGGGARGAAAHVAAGFLAEAASCVLWVPIDVVKERVQVARHASAREAVRAILAARGPAGLYAGYAATLASFGPFSALYFALYEAFLPAARGGGGGRPPPGGGGPPQRRDGDERRQGGGGGDERQEGGGGDGDERRRRRQAAALTPSAEQPAAALRSEPHAQLLAAAAAGGLASWATSPLDLIKLRLQVGPAADGSRPYAGMLDGLRRVAAAEGARGLWRGALARVFFHVPSTAVSMLLFESCTDAVRAWLGE